MFRSILLASVLFSASFSFAKVNRPDQYILLAFDGSKSLSFWQNSRAFAQANNIDFTYFVSGVYFLPDADRKNYVEPSHGVGKSNIGWGGTPADIKPRLQQMLKAMNEGHEMASHANAHFDGTKYSEKQWNSEFEQFAGLMVHSWEKYGDKTSEPTWWKNYWSPSPNKSLGEAMNHSIGFRAPLLGRGPGLYAALRNYNYLYDTSKVDKMGYWPQQIDGVWNFPLAGVRIAALGKNTLSMDYNFYFTQSKGVKGPASKFKEYEDQMFNTYMSYFENNYYGNRAPVHIGHHFSLWNGGAYWNAMQRFVKNVCTRPEVHCVTYKELLAFVELNKANIPAYQKGDFDKMPGSHLRTRVRELTEDELNVLRAQADAHFETHDEE
jgi:peptidoglycan/xylan/chitin deacetylase (PgdA/CDA1 family)